MNRIILTLFPELERLPTKKAQREAWSIATRTVGTSWRYWAAIAGVVAASVVIQFSHRRLGIPMAWRGMSRWLVVAVTVMACWAILLAFRKTIRRILWHVLKDHGIPCCTACGYDLTGNASGTCSECGEALNPDGE